MNEVTAFEVTGTRSDWPGALTELPPVEERLLRDHGDPSVSRLTGPAIEHPPSLATGRRDELCTRTLGGGAEEVVTDPQGSAEGGREGRREGDTRRVCQDGVDGPSVPVSLDR